MSNSGLIKEERKSVIFVNIKDGKFVVKNKKGEPEIYDALQGILSRVDFKMDEYQGKTYELAKVTINYVGEIYVIQMRTDSGYFRGFCNTLKSGNYKDEITIKPSSVKNESGKTITTCFIQQNGKFLKHFYNKDNIGDLPPLDKIEFKGKTQYDNSKQIAFWKNWLSSLFEQNTPKQSPKLQDEDFEDYADDLPF
jgi:hypothetical protein